MPEAKPDHTRVVMATSNDVPYSKLYTVSIMQCSKGGYIVLVGKECCARSSLDDALDFIGIESRKFLEDTVEPPISPTGHGGRGVPPSENFHPSGNYEHGVNYRERLQEELSRLYPKVLSKPQYPEERSFTPSLAMTVGVLGTMAMSFILHLSYRTWWPI